MNHPKLTLISHHLCPYVQRAAIALRERDVPFERRDIDLGDKPDWFLKRSPLGKVPVLVVDDDVVLFESSVIAQYVDETTGGHLLSSDPLEKYGQLAWLEYSSQVIASIGRLYNADDQSAVSAARTNLENIFRRLEQNLDEGPWFSNEHFTLVDAGMAPAFRYFDIIENLTGQEFFTNTPKVAAWRKALSERSSVIDAVSEDFTERLLSFIAARDSVIGRLANKTIAAHRAAA
ncbi:MAG: glutathione S-transferase family protein [Gammaproteobacteria bacterium]|nr:glutathione S-transferase family protein [Gammaproteobacteria bacterium]